MNFKAIDGGDDGFVLMNNQDEAVFPRLFHVNIRSAKKHHGELQLLLERLTHKFDVVAATEINVMDLNDCPDLDGYVKYGSAGKDVEEEAG